MNARPLASGLFLAFALAAPSTAQAPEKNPTLAALAEMVKKAHRPDGEVAPINALSCSLELHLIDARAEQGGQANMTVRFMNWRKEGSKKVRPLIRYAVQESKTPIVRGRDKHGPWQLHRGEPKSLRSADFAEQDLKTFKQHTNLVKQLLRFLSPENVIHSLRNPGLVGKEKLKVNRKNVPCLTITGQLDAFPLLQQSGEDAPVELKIFVNAKTGELLAADATPIIDGKPVPARGERMLLRRMDKRDGILVPMELQQLYRDGNKLRAVSRVNLTAVNLRPKFTAADFDR